jgi:hypothetical protein
VKMVNTIVAILSKCTSNRENGWSGIWICTHLIPGSLLFGTSKVQLITFVIPILFKSIRRGLLGVTSEVVVQSFCWYWWNCWPSLFKLCFHKIPFLHISGKQIWLVLP